jgi:hypothetical protein
VDTLDQRLRGKKLKKCDGGLRRGGRSKALNKKMLLRH